MTQRPYRRGQAKYKRKTKNIVQTAKENKYQYDYIIIALPPANVCKISFQPQLIIDRNCSKVLFLYDKPYWIEKGFSGDIISDCFDSAVFNTFDDSRTKQNGQKQYAIVVFINGASARCWMQREDWVKLMTEKLSGLFQSPQMLKPIRIAQKLGSLVICFRKSNSFFPTWSSLTNKKFKKTIGKIHWAGTELATVSQGFMDGVIQSGIRVATSEVLDRMNSQMKQQQEKKQQVDSFGIQSLQKNPKMDKWF